MMKFLSVEQIKDLDSYTITHEPIPSINLMERAATACSDWIMDLFPGQKHADVVCGSGNNGGDGLAIARRLAVSGWKVRVFYPDFTTQSADFAVNLKRLTEIAGVSVTALKKADHLPEVPQGSIVIDAIFGSGLKRPLEGAFATWVGQINVLDNIVVAVDIPSGVFADKPTRGLAVEADFTLSFEVPKKAFVIPENGGYVGEWVILPIGLHKDRMAETDSNWLLPGVEEIAGLVRFRKKYEHKGSFGHALIIAGSRGKGGAAVLASRAALRTGVGLVTAHIPGSIAQVVQTALPEAMVNIDDNDSYFSGLKGSDRFTTIGIGPGLGTHSDSASALMRLLKDTQSPVVLDADALNMIALSPSILAEVPPNSILTPHLKEFEHMFGKCENHFERLARLHTVAMAHQIVIILKGAHTAIATPEGNIFFNTTGNPGMATAGSGDVLTGMLTSLLAQRYSPGDAALLGVCLHGLAGDLCADMMGEEAMIAGDIVDRIGAAYQFLRKRSYDEKAIY